MSLALKRPECFSSSDSGLSESALPGAHGRWRTELGTHSGGPTDVSTGMAYDVDAGPQLLSVEKPSFELQKVFLYPIRRGNRRRAIPVELLKLEPESGPGSKVIQVHRLLKEQVRNRACLQHTFLCGSCGSRHDA